MDDQQVRADQQIRALRALRFNWALSADDVWDSSPYHVSGIHRRAERRIIDDIDDLTTNHRSSPLGLVIEGTGGTGKTHLLGWARQQVQERDGYFFLVDFSTGTDFWSNAARQMRASLQTVRAGTDKSQLGILLRHLSVLSGVKPAVAAAVSGGIPPSRIEVKNFLKALLHLDSDVVRTSQETLRALVLYASADLELQTIGDNYLSSRPPADEKEAHLRMDWALNATAPSPQAVVEQLSRLVALSGPSVVAVDQIDGLIDVAARARHDDGDPDGRHRHGGRDGRQTDRLAEMASGLMDLRQMTRRTLCIVSCIPSSWQRVRDEAVTTAADRFRTSVILGTLTDSGTAWALVEKRFAHRYGTVGFTPPHPTWPVSPAAFEEQSDLTPRQLLQAIDRHVDRCLDDEDMTELTSFADPGHGQQQRKKTELELEPLDHRYNQLLGWFDPAKSFDPASEDDEIPTLLAAALKAWIIEHGDDEQFAYDVVANSKRPDVHARLRKILDPETERQEQWCFRAIAHSNPVAVQTRLQNAIDASGLGSPDRYLTVLRADPWPTGPKTKALAEQFERLGGRVVDPDRSDLACFFALRKLFIPNDAHLVPWLRWRRPASNTKLLSGLEGIAAA